MKFACGHTYGFSTATELRCQICETPHEAEKNVFSMEEMRMGFALAGFDPEPARKPVAKADEGDSRRSEASSVRSLPAADKRSKTAYDLVARDVSGAGDTVVLQRLRAFHSARNSRRV